MPEDFNSAIKQAADSLKAAGASEVYVFGSTASGTAREDSDVDLAVSGLPPEVFFKAMAKAGAFFKRPFDLVDLDEPSPFTDYLKKNGKLRRVA